MTKYTVNCYQKTNSAIAAYTVLTACDIYATYCARIVKYIQHDSRIHSTLINNYNKIFTTSTMTSKWQADCTYVTVNSECMYIRLLTCNTYTTDLHRYTHINVFNALLNTFLLLISNTSCQAKKLWKYYRHRTTNAI